MLIAADSTLAPGALLPNRAGAARLERPSGQPAALQWRGLAPRRSWRPLRLSAAGARAELFLAALHILEGGEARALPPRLALPLWRAGLLLTPAEHSSVPDGPGPELDTAASARPWLPPEDAGARLWDRLFAGFAALSRGPAPPAEAEPARFAAMRTAWLPGLLQPAEAAAAAGVLRRLSDAGLLHPTDRGACINNDPLGRALLHRLTPTVERIVGAPLRPSYTFAMDYGPGSTLPMHTDRLQCEYTLSLLLDYLPLPADGRSPWPLEVETRPVGTMAAFLQAPGDGLLFCGRELRHGRPELPADARSLVLMLHWVDAGFADADMDLS